MFSQSFFLYSLKNYCQSNLPYLNNKSDSDLWSAVKAGKAEAFEALYQQYAQTLFRFGFRTCDDKELVQDIVQQLFTDIWRQREGLAAVENVSVYLLRAFRYKLFRALKKKGKYQYELPENFAIRTSPETEWILEEIQNSQIDELKNAITNLPIRQREVITLKYFKGMSNTEIGEILEINSQSVANLLYRGLTNLRKKISKKSDLW